MDSTHDFVERIHDKQRKDRQNRKRQGRNDPSNKLPGKNKK
ncbi:Protein of unknown function [Salinibacillus kushneri]|uniref:DUF4023 domain-containing protein n=1 Tax=Salinibacillus kushneri TaxID=237682 RepID=A0A1I0BBM8_9BACI|nr:DUF4023 domain-containing protein [Salinibacillus kushneri]SET04177.1 Protein of unknown function [Salinibacillus kushneri]